MIGLLLIGSITAQARTKDRSSNDTTQTEKGEHRDEKGASIQRIPGGTFENVKNLVSDVEFFTSNYGIFGNDVAAGVAGGIWPRGSGHKYIFGGGLWFGAKKDVTMPDGTVQRRELSEIGYDPNSGASWMTPGRITGSITDSPIDDSQGGINKYRVYMSTNYNSFNGAPIDEADARQGGPNWPIWDVNPLDTLRMHKYFGTYIDDTTQRNRTAIPKGPAIISGEDIFTTYKDSDLQRYEGEQEPGHPLGIQVEQTDYTWGFGKSPADDGKPSSPYKDMVFLSYRVINMSPDTLWDCYMAPAMDMDIGVPSNDRAKFVAENGLDTLNLAVQWSDVEPTGRYGYIGYDFLESPAIVRDVTSPDFGFIRKDTTDFSNSEQIGLTTFQTWPIEEDPLTSTERYEFISAGDLDGDNGPGDRRFLMSTGPFNMRPGDTARVVVGVLFANGISNPPTGTVQDMRLLLAVDTFAQEVYDKNFLAPIPPDRAKLSWEPLNNGVLLKWDSTSEVSYDPVESGLDFKGYTIQRERKVSSPKFSPDPNDTTSGWDFGWTTVQSFVLPDLPTNAQRYKAAVTGDQSYLGAWGILPMLADTCPGGAYDTLHLAVYDTLKRVGASDTLIVRPGVYFRDTAWCFAFDPSNDLGLDSGAWDSYGEAFVDKSTRDIVHDAIRSIMDSVTNHRTFIDVGDDNHDGQIVTDATDLSQNERLINNVDYYYQLLAFDEGSKEEGTPSKVNSGVLDINEVRSTPEAPPAGPPASPTVIDTSGLGGISNVQFLVYDQERLGQLFGDDTIDFIFNPIPRADGFLLLEYLSKVTMVSHKKGDLGTFYVAYNGKFTDIPGILDVYRDSVWKYGYRTIPHIVGSDTTFDTVYVDHSRISDTYYPNPIQPVLGTVGIYRNTFGLSFDYDFDQSVDTLTFGRTGEPGSRQNPFTVNAASGANVNLVADSLYPSIYSVDPTSHVLTYAPITSIGRGKIEVTFEPCDGCSETLQSNNRGDTITFPNVPYLNLKVRFVGDYDIDEIGPDGQTHTRTVSYSYDFPADKQAQDAADSALTGTTVPLARTVGMGQYALYAYGWLNTGSLDKATRLKFANRANASASSRYLPIGTPNRYYQVPAGMKGVPSADGDDLLSFTHLLVVNGAEVLLDYAGMGSVGIRAEDQNVPETTPTQDFQPGDKVAFDLQGGAAGLPVPGAKVSVAIQKTVVPSDQITDDELDAIRVVPNPYLISHIGQQSNTARKLYFTRLPVDCTIQIYTEAGELLQTIEHHAPTSDGRIAVDAWDLLTKANRQAQSQLMIARITTPSGAETIKKFAVVVGGFRIVE